MLSLSKSKGMIMKCPTCTDTPLVMAERQGVEIDYCPVCRGLWLDRGELDKLLDGITPAVACTANGAGHATPYRLW
jgi:Zn-finger nucleic acid-binding protein